MLATLNGTLRDDEGQTCQNCGEVGHRKYDCPQIRSFNAGIICRRCGQAGHFQKDCKVNLSAQAGGYGGGANGPSGGDFDKEYQELMAEVGGGAGGGSGGYGQSAGRIESGGPSPWQQPQPVVASVAPWVPSPSSPPFPISLKLY